MRFAIVLVAIVGGVGCGAEVLDPCASVTDSACVSLYVDETPPIDRLEMRVVGLGEPRSAAATAPGGKPFGPPLVMALAINDALLSAENPTPLTIDVFGFAGDAAVSQQLGATLALRASEHRGLHVKLGAFDADLAVGVDAAIDLRMPDLAKPDLVVDDLVLPAVEPLTIAPDSGTYATAVNVTLQTATLGVTTCYTLDGSSPSCDANALCAGTSTAFLGTLTVSSTAKVSAIACKQGMAPSAVVSRDYVINIPPTIVSPVLMNPASGQFANDTTVTLSTMPVSATICYRQDGIDPVCDAGNCIGSSTKYVGTPVVITGLAPTIRAIGCQAGATSSDISNASYAFKVGAPTSDVPGGFVAMNTVPTLSTVTTSAVIHYTTNGVAATCTTGNTSGSNNFVSLAALTQNTTVSAIACRTGYTDSDGVQLVYNVKVAAPILSPPPGSYSSNVSITATGTTGTVCFTGDGTTPVCAGAGCSVGSSTGPVIDMSRSVRAVACGTPGQTVSSDVVLGSYTRL